MNSGYVPRLADQLITELKRWREVARRLVRTNGLSLRDAAAVMGVNFSRVQQLLKD